MSSAAITDKPSTRCLHILLHLFNKRFFSQRARGYYRVEGKRMWNTKHYFLEILSLSYFVELCYSGSPSLYQFSSTDNGSFLGSRKPKQPYEWMSYREVRLSIGCSISKTSRMVGIQHVTSMHCICNIIYDFIEKIEKWLAEWIIFLLVIEIIIDKKITQTLETKNTAIQTRAVKSKR